MSFMTIHDNPTLQGLAKTIPDVVYSTATGVPLKATILVPWAGENTPRPTILFVQGSGFTFPNINLQLPQLGQFAQAGYVVMTITHRNCLDGHPFPAYLQDVKCAVRFLRAHAETYGIDPERIAIAGTSSGANASLLTAMTPNDPRYKTDEYAQFSDHVSCVVDCSGPAFLVLKQGSLFRPVHIDRLRKLCGDRPEDEVLFEMSPGCIAQEGKKYPPMLIVHGDADEVVAYAGSVALYEKMRALGQDVRMICVHNGMHGQNLWSQEVFQHIRSFVDEHLK